MMQTENPIRINSQKSSLVKELIKNINEYKKILKTGIVHFLDHQKMIFGVGRLRDNTLYLAERKCDLNKFGITDNFLRQILIF